MNGNAPLSLLRDLIEERIGYHYGELHLPLLIERLSSRLRELQLRDLLDYYYYLCYDAQAAEEWSRLYRELVVPETYFCREFDALRMAVTRLLPRLPQRVRIWHAGCSSGEEPYTMAMLLAELGIGQQVELIATDLDEHALLKARQGIYSGRSLRSIRPDWLATHFQRRPDGRYQFDRDLMARVRFQKLNLMERPAVRALGECHLVFCRNVFIYFSPAVIERVVEDISQLLLPGGHLLVGVCESLLRVRTALKLTQTDRIASYQKQVVS